MPASKKSSGSEKGRNVKFEEIQRKNLELLKERIQPDFESSDEDENNLDDDLKNSLLKNYKGDESDVTKVLQILDGDSNDDCLICIRRIKNKEKIWSCDGCFYAFHLLCIQKWRFNESKEALV
jgi:hypothetical protein